jgi:hypothetical protein
MKYTLCEGEKPGDFRLNDWDVPASFEENMKVIALLLFILSFSGAAIAAPATHKPAAWWGHSSNHHEGKAVRPHTGRRNLSTHPERRRRMK